MIKHSRPGYLKMTEHLETQIASGSYRAGDKLPGLRALSEEFALTTYAVHEGLKALSRKGGVDSAARFGRIRRRTARRAQRRRRLACDGVRLDRTPRGGVSFLFVARLSGSGDAE